MARISRPLQNLLVDLMLKVFEYLSQLHPDNTFREQRALERKIYRLLETIAEYMAVIHEEGLNDLDESEDSKDVGTETKT